jgi:hypothetical protein
VTVSTLVAAGSAKAAEIAEAYWRLHAEDAQQWRWEVVIS